MLSRNIIDLRKPQVITSGGEAVKYYKRITWANGIPVNIKKYTNEARTVLAHDVTITWANGVPVSISDLDVVSGITTVSPVVWENGLPIDA